MSLVFRIDSIPHGILPNVLLNMIMHVVLLKYSYFIQPISSVIYFIY